MDLNEIITFAQLMRIQPEGSISSSIGLLRWNIGGHGIGTIQLISEIVDARDEQSTKLCRRLLERNVALLSCGWIISERDGRFALQCVWIPDLELHFAERYLAEMHQELIDVMREVHEEES